MFHYRSYYFTLESTSQATNKEKEVSGMKIIRRQYCHYLRRTCSPIQEILMKNYGKTVREFSMLTGYQINMQ